MVGKMVSKMVDLMDYMLDSVKVQKMVDLMEK